MKNNNLINNLGFVSSDVFDLIVFDENGNEVVNLNALTESKIFYNSENAFVGIKTPYVIPGLLKFLHAEEKVELTDFDRYIKNNKSTVIKVNKENSKECKLVAKTVVYNSDTNCIAADIIYEIPTAHTINNFEWLGDCKPTTSEFNYVFKISPYDEEGNLFKIHITER